MILFIIPTARITNKPPYDWDDLFKKHLEVPPEELQFSIWKRWKPPTHCSKGYRKVNNNSPYIQTEGANSHSIKTNISPQKEQVGARNQQNNNSSSSMDREGDKWNDEYYVLIQTRSGWIIVKPNRFDQASTISLGLNAMISYELHGHV